MKKTSYGESGVLNVTTPSCLRGGKEHKALKLSQLQRDSNKYVYHENVRNGSFITGNSIGGGIY